MFMDFSKVFDTIRHDLIIAQLDAYSFSYDALQYMRSYLTNRKQRVPVNSDLSTWENIIAGIPQGSIRIIVIHDLHQWSFSFRFKFKFKHLCQWQHIICLWLWSVKHKDYNVFWFWLSFKMIWRKLYGSKCW